MKGHGHIFTVRRLMYRICVLDNSEGSVCGEMFKLLLRKCLCGFQWGLVHILK